MLMVDEELQRRFAALEVADREWREHRLTGWEAWSRARSWVSPTHGGFTPAWRAREEELRAQFEAARKELLACLPGAEVSMTGRSRRAE